MCAVVGLPLHSNDGIDVFSAHAQRMALAMMRMVNVAAMAGVEGGGSRPQQCTSCL